MIPLPKQLLPMLKEMKKRSSSELVITGNEKILSVRSYQRSFELLLKKNGIPYRGFHAIRHSTASLILANGVPMKMIQDWLGHSDMGTTANIYSHLDSNSKIASAATIGNALALSNEG